MPRGDAAGTASYEIGQSALVLEARGAPRGEREATAGVGRRLGVVDGKRLLVPEPGDPSRIRMAPPFSGIETPFLVHADDKGYYANCVWDAYGVAAALRADALIEAEDGCTGEAITLEVKGFRPVPQQAVAHFAVPAAHWWDDIVYT